MKSLLLNPSKTEKKQSGGLFTPVRKGIVQQKCACGGTPGLTGECAECRRKGLFDRERSFLRPKLIISQPNERSEEEADSTAERASMESRVGHDFSRVRVNRIGSDVIQPKRAIRPPSSDLPTLRRQASIYRHGQTPVVDERGNLRAWGVTPASAEVTARHLGEVRGRFGEEGLARSVRGLAITRGADFADEAMRRAAVPVRKEATVVQASAANREASAGISSSVDASPPSAISGARPGKPLPADLRARLAALSGHSLARLSHGSGRRAAILRPEAPMALHS